MATLVWPLPVPPGNGAGRDQPVHPRPYRQEPDQRGEGRAAGPARPIGAAQHGGLVPRREQLRVPGRRRATERDQPAAEPNEDQKEQAKRHGWPWLIAAARRHRPASGTRTLLDDIAAGRATAATAAGQGRDGQGVAGIVFTADDSGMACRAGL